jgi:hypothetical protein
MDFSFEKRCLYARTYVIGKLRIIQTGKQSFLIIEDYIIVGSMITYDRAEMKSVFFSFQSRIPSFGRVMFRVAFRVVLCRVA